MENKIICPNCSVELPLDSEFCQYCGKAIPQTKRDNHEEIKNVPESKKEYEQSITKHTLMKGFMLIEDKDWKKAEKCFDDILEENIKCSDAYIGKLLIELRLESKKDLLKTFSNLEKNKNFIRAYKFADESQKNILNYIIKQNRINLENKKQRQKKTKKRILIASLSIILATCIGVGGFFGYKKIIFPSKQYAKAQKFLDNKQYEDAMSIYKALGTYKDSEEMYTNTKNSFYYQKGKELSQTSPIEAYNYFMEIKDYKNTRDIINNNSIMCKLDKLQGIWYFPGTDFESREKKILSYGYKKIDSKTEGNVIVAGKYIDPKTGDTVCRTFGYIENRITIYGSKITFEDGGFASDYGTHLTVKSNDDNIYFGNFPISDIDDEHYVWQFESYYKQ